MLSFYSVPSSPPPAARECFPAIIRFPWDASRVSALCRKYFCKAICSFLLARVLRSSIPAASGLQLPPRHIQVVEDAALRGRPNSFQESSVRSAGIAKAFVEGNAVRAPWCDSPQSKPENTTRLEALRQDSYAALKLMRASMHRKDVLVNDQSILNYWASAFFPVLEPGTFLYPSGSGTLGYALPAAIGVACAVKRPVKRARSSASPAMAASNTRSMSWPPWRNMICR